MKTPANRHEQHGNYPDERSRPAPPRADGWLAQELAKHLADLAAMRVGVSPRK